MPGDQLTSTVRDAFDGSQMVQGLLERNNDDPNKGKDPLIQLQKLRKRIAEMKVEVNQQEVRSTGLRQLVGLWCEELDQRCMDSGNGSISTDDVTDPVPPAVLSPSGGEVD